MEEHKIVQRNVELQREWYGEPLGDRVRRLVVAFDVSQAYLAEVLGISAPMLSQVMSGRRAKIGNPVVLARMLMLERKVLTPAIASGDVKALEAALEDVRDSRPTVGMETVPIGGGSGYQVVLAALREIAEEENLVQAATVLDHEFPVIADVLRKAGNGR